MTPAASGVGACVDDLPRISPELVLVDPELSRRVRPRLPLLFLRRRAPLPPLHLQIAPLGTAEELSADPRSTVQATPTA
jgi:hypothetical protein